jgi:hypothetical protein
LSSDPSSTRYPNVKKNLEPMNHEYKKAFRVRFILWLSVFYSSLHEHV